MFEKYFKPYSKISLKSLFVYLVHSSSKIEISLIKKYNYKEIIQPHRKLIRYVSAIHARTRK